MDTQGIHSRPHKHREWMMIVCALSSQCSSLLMNHHDTSEKQQMLELCRLTGLQFVILWGSSSIHGHVRNEKLRNSAANQRLPRPRMRYSTSRMRSRTKLAPWWEFWQVHNLTAKLWTSRKINATFCRFFSTDFIVVLHVMFIKTYSLLCHNTL